MGNYQLARLPFSEVQSLTSCEYKANAIDFWILSDNMKIVGNSVWKTLNSAVAAFMKEQYFQYSEMVFGKFKPVLTIMSIDIRSIPKL